MAGLLKKGLKISLKLGNTTRDSQTTRSADCGIRVVDPCSIGFTKLFAKNRIFKFKMPISRITILYPVAYFLNQ